jgi:predicted transcriptional regulator
VRFAITSILEAKKMNVILAIKSEHAEAILSGAKKYEFRKRAFKREDIKRVYLCVSGGAIVGSFEIEFTLLGSPQAVWRTCHEDGAISKQDFFDYFGSRNEAVAHKVKNPERCEGNALTRPQSFCYMQ